MIGPATESSCCCSTIWRSRRPKIESTNVGPGSAPSECGIVPRSLEPELVKYHNGKRFERIAKSYLNGCSHT
jgi:hypothetical protein